MLHLTNQLIMPTVNKDICLAQLNSMELELIFFTFELKLFEHAKKILPIEIINKLENKQNYLASRTNDYKKYHQQLQQSSPEEKQLKKINKVLEELLASLVKNRCILWKELQFLFSKNIKERLEDIALQEQPINLNRKKLEEQLSSIEILFTLEMTRIIPIEKLQTRLEKNYDQLYQQQAILYLLQHWHTLLQQTQLPSNNSIENTIKIQTLLIEQKEGFFTEFFKNPNKHHGMILFFLQQFLFSNPSLKNSAILDEIKTQQNNYRKKIAQREKQLQSYDYFSATISTIIRSSAPTQQLINTYEAFIQALPYGENYGQPLSKNYRMFFSVIASLAPPLIMEYLNGNWLIPQTYIDLVMRAAIPNIANIAKLTRGEKNAVNVLPAIKWLLGLTSYLTLIILKDWLTSAHDTHKKIIFFTGNYIFSNASTYACEQLFKALSHNQSLKKLFSNSKLIAGIKWSSGLFFYLLYTNPITRDPFSVQACKYFLATSSNYSTSTALKIVSKQTSNISIKNTINNLTQLAGVFLYLAFVSLIFGETNLFYNLVTYSFIIFCSTLYDYATNTPLTNFFTSTISRIAGNSIGSFLWQSIYPHATVSLFFQKPTTEQLLSSHETCLQHPEDCREAALEKLKLPSNATLPEIKKQYRQLALSTYPGKNNHTDTNEFIRIAQAKERLCELEETPSITSVISMPKLISNK